MSTVTASGDSRVLLHNVSWQQYVDLRDADENRHTRMTYDRGSLEFMSPSWIHERIGILIELFIFAWTDEEQVLVQSCGSTTHRREDLDRGLEPDKCYYLEHEPVMRDHPELDLTIDPPPDLVVEVDITSSSINRLSIYAALGVPEIWRWHDDRLQIFRLGGDRQYGESAMSQALQGFPSEKMVELILQDPYANQTSLIREFRHWCRAQK